MNPIPNPPSPVPALEARVSASLLRLRMRSPFFATLALFARFRPTLELPTAATDGRDVFYNPQFMGALSDEHFDGVLLHEVLHAALGHVPRRSRRDPQGWNIAADIVVNGILMESGFSLPEGHVREVSLESYSVEEVYALLPREPQPPVLVYVDLLEEPPEGEGEGKSPEGGKDKPEKKPGRARGKRLGEGDLLGEAHKAELEKHWKAAIGQAQAVARALGHGHLPAGVERAFGLAGPPQLDWKSVLWRFLVRTPSDFAGFDRRQIARGFYLETLEGEKLRIYIGVDTSGSVDDGQIQLFLSEVQGILRAYPHLEALLYYADAALYGPYPLSSSEELPPPQGGGGTDFRPFFAEVAERQEPHLGGVCVYLTDGFGDFPAEAPELPTLWVVAPGGLDVEQFPFGEAIKLI
jgi:predicted metal-dependent peptidase